MSQDSESNHPLDGLIKYKDFIGGLVGDLNDLRAGKITVGQARARADLAKQIVRGIAVALDAQRLLIEGAKEINTLPNRHKEKRRG